MFDVYTCVYDLIFFSRLDSLIYSSGRLYVFIYIFIFNRNLGGNALDEYCISRRILMRLPGSFLNHYRFCQFQFLYFVFDFVYDPVNKSRQ